MSVIIQPNPGCGTSHNVLSVIEALDETLLLALLDHPSLFNRPILCWLNGLRLCRLNQALLSLLDRLLLGSMSKEDGTPLLDMEGHRLG